MKGTQLGDRTVRNDRRCNLSPLFGTYVATRNTCGVSTVIVRPSWFACAQACMLRHVHVFHTLRTLNTASPEKLGYHALNQDPCSALGGHAVLQGTHALLPLFPLSFLALSCRNLREDLRSRRAVVYTYGWQSPSDNCVHSSIRCLVFVAFGRFPSLAPTFLCGKEMVQSLLLTCVLRGPTYHGQGACTRAACTHTS